VNLRLQTTTGKLTDETFVYFEQGATAAFDARYDAYKLPSSSGLSLGSIIAGEELSVNGLTPLAGPTASTTVPLNVHVPAAGSYTLNAASLVNFDANTQVLLLDTQTGARINLAQQPLYSFTASSPSLPGRFSLLFGPAAPLAANNAVLAQQVQLFPNPAHGSFTLLLPAELGRSVTATLYNQLGQVVVQRTVSVSAAGATAQFDVSNLALGIYSLRLGSGKSQVVKRVVVE
ncbi:MAG TPA: T9SS type A sorting domain-containing protein, partial [Hymenobacter sp.]